MFSEKTDDELITLATTNWANYIESFDITMSAEVARNKVYSAKNHYEPNLLTSEQKVLVKRLRKIAQQSKTKRKPCNCGSEKITQMYAPIEDFVCPDCKGSRKGVLNGLRTSKH